MITCGTQIVSGAPVYGGGGDVQSVAVSLASSAGWTARTGAFSGSASVNTTAQQIELGCTVAGPQVFASIGRAPPSSAPIVDYRARLSSLVSGGGASDLASLQVADALAQTVLIGVEIAANNTARTITASAAGAAVSIASVAGGQGWARMVLSGSLARCYAGVGSGGSEPTSWTDLGTVTLASGHSAPWVYLLFQANRGTATNLTATWTSISYAEIA